jgi:hypothetical protein
MTIIEVCVQVVRDVWWTRWCTRRALGLLSLLTSLIQESAGCASVYVGSYEIIHLAESGVHVRCAAAELFNLVCTTEA